MLSQGIYKIPYPPPSEYLMIPCPLHSCPEANLPAPETTPVHTPVPIPKVVQTAHDHPPETSNKNAPSPQRCGHCLNLNPSYKSIERCHNLPTSSAAIWCKLKLLCMGYLGSHRFATVAPAICISQTSRASAPPQFLECSRSSWTS